MITSSIKVHELLGVDMSTNKELLKTQLHGKDFIEGNVQFAGFLKPQDKKKKLT